MIDKKILYSFILSLGFFIVPDFAYSFANILETECYTDKIIIKINHLKTHYQADNNNRISLKIDNSNNIFQKNGKINFDELHFNLALLQISSENITINQKKLVSIGKIEVKDLDILNETNLIVTTGIVNSGIQRGVPIASLNIQPFEFDFKNMEIKALQSVEIVIHLPKPIPLSELQLNETEKSFFASIINKKHLNYYLQQRLSDKKSFDRILSSDYWYSPDKTYLKITTTKDGIAFINGSDSALNRSSFMGKQTKYLHLLHKGIEKPIYFMNDTDGILDANDRILFIGLRPIGDTTWFNVFSNENVFFLVYDENYEGIRISQFQGITQPLEPIEKIKVNNHIEYDKIYYRGYFDFQIGTETVDAEAWYWDFISPFPDYQLANPYEKETFTYSTLLNSDINSSDSIKFTLYLKSKEFLKLKSTPFHILKGIINYDTIATYQVEHWKADTVVITYPLSKLNSGINKIMLKSFFTRDIENNIQQPDDVWIDYINVEGMIKPYAFNGKLDFEVNNLISDSEIKTKSFNSQYIYVIDSSKKIIQLPETERGSLVRATIVNGKKPSSGIVMNDSILCDSVGQGMHVGILRSPDYKAEYKLFTVFESELDNYLQNIPDSSIICLANNSEGLLPLSTRNIIQNLGSKEIVTRVPGQSWAFVVRKGNLNSVIEKRITSGTAQLDEYIKHGDGVSYSGKIKLPKGSSYKLLCRDESSIEHASIYSVTPTNLRDTTNRFDLLVITHNKFGETADSLAHYRERTHNIKAMVVDVDDIYKEFSYGIKTPHAIKDFLKTAYFTWDRPAPVYLTLVGDACWDYRKLSPNAKYIDYVPSYGWPVSDHWYTRLDGDDFLSEIIIGRIPIMDNPTGLKYIQKIKEYDSIPLRPWMKNFLFLSGGMNSNERFEFWDLVTLCSDNITLRERDLCGDTITIKKTDDIPGSATEGPEIISKINSGAIWVSFLGHSSPTIFDMDGWNADRLNNKPKYNFLTTYGCNTGAFSEPDLICRNEEYLLEPDRASIGVGGPSSAGIVVSDKVLMANMIDGLADTTLNIRQIGEIINYGKSQLWTKGIDTVTIYQFTLLGDPMVKLKIKTQPDLYTVPEEIELTNKNGETVITESDSLVTISGFIYNGGYCQYDSVEFRLIREFENYRDTIVIFVPGICMEAPFQFTIPVWEMPGKHKVTLEIDPYYMLRDSNTDNNYAVITFEVFSQGLVPLEPLPYWDMKATVPVFRVIDPVCNNNIKYNFEIRDKKDLTTDPVYSSLDDEITDYGTHLEWKPQSRFENNQPYWFVAYKKSTTGLVESKVLWIPFSTTSSKDSGLVKYIMHGKEQLSTMQLDSLSIITIDDTSRITFETKFLPFKLVSIHGITGLIVRGVEIRLDDKPYIEDYTGSQAPIGFYIVVASGIDGSFKMKRNFDTWSDSQTLNGVKFVRFLKDSVDSNDYVLIATYGASFRLFWDSLKYNPKSIGSFDSLRYYLRQYGSKLADSITAKTSADPNSFVMLGRRGSPVGSIPEALNTEGNVAQITGNIEIKLRKGHLKTPVIGPAKHWKNLSFTGKIDSVNTKNKIIVFGLPYDKNDSVKLIENDTSLSIDLSEIRADEYPYLKVETGLERSNDTSVCYITSFSSCFNPLPELSFVKDNCVIKSDSIMRGELFTTDFVIKNISNRIASEKSAMDLILYSDNNSPITDTKDIGKLQMNEESQTSFDIETISLETNTHLLASLSLDSSQKDIYTFNNSEKRILHIIEDKIKPTIELQLDGIKVKNGDYVSITPNVEISLFDNSIQPVNEGDIQVRINAKYIDSTAENNYFFDPKGTDRPVKAKLSFISDSLDIGENIITIMFSDATGNRDTSRVTVFVSLNGFIENVKNSPNPFENSTSFSFYFKAPHQGSTANISVYNVSGQKVSSFKKEIFIGTNEFDWEARDENGASLPIGMYFYRITIESEFYVDPLFGKFVIMR
ncbi:MAG: hypothetical protein A2X61_03965 [Ignavibacteria bacterium GWB2_35_12]|nr:MAG: hypothetical protein A2X61_03965 [Ignavibacteria bacterium GWB2_35_12]OGU93997.1 MAG: hypothetical protein A2220_04575 [Ignavibacteria bacterium RIFOXYA2_FULL_35_10]OGV22854.1 MAG: hypothetical protein A2475_02415 [Ignavibacteria bacterium RIFOXYC2_FULL_35_21]